MAPGAWRPNARRWVIAPPFDSAEAMARRIGTAPLVAQMLYNRGIDCAQSAKAFLNPNLSDLHDPEQLTGCAAAAGRVAQAVANKEKIVIYGDYDVDGITGVAILHEILTMVGADVDFYVPHRLDEGYGVNSDAVAALIADGAKLLITVDCGIGAVEPLAAAAEAGVDVVVTDHHSLPARMPEVCAIVHPALPEGQYPNADLAGAGVAFKLAWQIAREICGNHRVDDAMRDFLLRATCLAALGTIADVVPLVGENRVLALHGLRALPTVPQPGIQALIKSAGLTGGKIDAYHVGFVLAPRLNACGRMGHARLAVELLTTAAGDRCDEIAKYLAKQNSQRQQVERAITQEAIEMVTSGGLDAPEHRAIVLSSPQWHGGVIGIVASRLMKRFGRPAILIAINGEGQGQGSGRSIPGFHIRDALADCAEHLVGFGGHAMAAGIRIEQERIGDFADAFLRVAGERISPEQLTPALSVDAETGFSALSYGVVDHIRRMAPFGQGNPRPVVVVRGCEVLSPPKRMGRTGSTVGLYLRQGGVSMRAVGFGMGELADALGGAGRIDVAGEPALNTFNGATSIELKLRDVKWA